MAKFPIYRSERTISGQAPAVRANYDPSTGSSQLIGAISDSVGKLSQTFMAIEQKKLEAIDLKSEMAIRNDYNKALADFETIKETTPPEEWDKKYDEIITQAKNKSSDYDMSQDKYDYLVNDIYGSGDGRIVGQSDVVKAKVQTGAIKQINKDNQVVAGVGLSDAFKSGDPAKIAQAEESFFKAHKTIRPEIVRDLYNKQRYDAVKERYQNIAAATPEQAIEMFQKKKDALTEGQADEDGLGASDYTYLIGYANTIKKQNEVTINDNYDLEAGKFTESVTKGMLDGTLTETDIWKMPIPVDEEKRADADDLRSKWVNIYRSNIDRKLSANDAEKKAKIDAKYNPVKVSELKAMAEDTTNKKDITELQTAAAAAMADGIIKESEYISMLDTANTKYDSIIKNTIKAQVGNYSDVALAGTSGEDILLWTQERIKDLKERGLPADSLAIRDEFVYIAQAKRWSVNQFQQAIEDAVKKQEITNPDDIEKIALRLQRIWLSKPKTQLVDEYNTWKTRN